MCIIIGAVTPRGLVIDYLKAYLRSCGESEIKTEAVHAKYCLRILHKVQNIKRKSAPSYDEFMAGLKMSPMRIKVKVPGGAVKTVSMDPTTTVKEYKAKIMELLDIAACTGYALFKVCDNVEFRLEDTDIMSDAICSIAKKYLTETVDSIAFAFRKRLITSGEPSKNEMEESLLLQQVGLSSKCELKLIVRPSKLYRLDFSLFPSKRLHISHACSCLLSATSLCQSELIFVLYDLI